jgi:hypothetical protein
MDNGSCVQIEVMDFSISVFSDFSTNCSRNLTIPGKMSLSGKDIFSFFSRQTQITN